MLSISINNLSLSFGDRVILDGVSFSLEESDKLGIIGVNGSGKTSLFKLITGEYEPTEGEVYISRDKSVGLLSQYGAFDGDGEDTSSVLENMYNAFPELLRAEARLQELESLLENHEDKNHSSYTNEYTALHEQFLRDGGLEFRGRCASILSKLGFSESEINSPVSILSGGQKTRLALAVELCREPDILMLDEPTNHLDIETLGWLESFLSQYKKCVMVISHDRYFLDRVTNKTLAIENHHAKLYSGNYTKSMAQRQTDREIYEKHYKNQQKEIARQEAYIAQQRAWNRERNIIAAESRLKMLEKMDKLDAPEASVRAIRMKFTPSVASGNDVVNVKNLGMGFPGKVLFSDLNFLVKRGNRLLILGPNGCGKSTLVKLLMNKLVPLSGKIEYGYNVQIGYYDQENQNLCDSNSVLEELWSAYPTLPEQKIRSTLAWFNFFGEDVYKTVGMLSGGERARLTFSKLILSHMNLLILDEPTNHLDIDSREALESALEDFDGTIIAVSHDRYFIEKLANRIIEIKPLGYFDGDMFDYEVSGQHRAYTEFCEFRENRKARLSQGNEGEQKAQMQTQSKEQYLNQKQSASEARKRQHRIEKLQKEMAALEDELVLVEENMSGESATDYKKLAELDTRKTEIEDRLMEIYEELEEIQ